MEEVTNDNEITNKNKHESWWEFLTLFVVVFGVYFLTLRFIFPGYFSPLIPFHSDFYIFYPALPHETLELLFMSSRFVGIFVRDIVGIFGMESTIIFLIILNAVNITLTVLLVKAVARIKLYWPLIILYLFLIFSHPGFYINYSYDFFDTLAYFFAVSAIFFWYKKIENIKNKYVLVAVLLIFLSLFSKETYFVPLFIFWCYQCFFSDGKQRKSAIIILGTTVLLVILSIFHSHLVNSPWVEIESRKVDPYFINMNLTSIIKTFLYYFKMWGNLGVIGLVALSLIISIISKKLFKEKALFFIIGLSAYIPYSLLPNHKYGCYYWLAVPLTYSVILFINPESIKLMIGKIGNRKLFNSLLIIFYVVVASLGAFSLKRYNDSYRDTEFQWTLQQENINRNMLANFPYIKNNISPSDKILVAGLTFPFHPFSHSDYVDSPNYIDSYFGNYQNIKWVVATYDDVDKDKIIGSIEFLGIKKIDVSKYDKIFVFDAEGKLIRKIEKDKIETNNIDPNIVSINDLILYPELNKYAGAGLEDNDWYNYMMMGNILSNAYPDRGAYFLNKAIQFSKDTNPYPYYFMGQLMERLGRNEEAFYNYNKAVELDDSKNKNKEFVIAVERVKKISK